MSLSPSGVLVHETGRHTERQNQPPTQTLTHRIGLVMDTSTAAEGDLMTFTKDRAENVTTPVELYLAYRMSVVLWNFYPPVVILLGTFGNVMSIVIMSRMTSGESTVYMFFIAIAVGDLLVLYSGMTMGTWLETTFQFRYITRWPALHFVLRWWVAPASGAVVCWMLMCVTLQRALAVIWPHHVTRVCTRRRVGSLVAVVTLSLAGLYSHYLYCIGVVSPENGSEAQCIRPSSYSGYAWFLDNVFVFVDMAVFSLLPFSSLVLGNTVLVWKLLSSREAQQSMMTAAPSRQIQKRSQANTSVTLTVLVVSFTFIVLTLPSGLYFLLFHFKDGANRSPREEADVFLFFTLSFLLVDSNSAVNFYLYCLTGRRFRQEFVKILRCWTGTEMSRRGIVTSSNADSIRAAESTVSDRPRS